jgi:hypothetical protein
MPNFYSLSGPEDVTQILKTIMCDEMELGTPKI